MSGYIPPGTDTRHVVTRHSYSPRTIGVSTGPLHLKGRHGSRGLRVACRHCNNGWMSRLQKSAKPALTPLLEGIGLAPNLDHQKRIASWATMFTIVYEQADPESAAITEGHRRAFRHDCIPDHHWGIWVGKFAGRINSGSTHHRAVSLIAQNSTSELKTIHPNAQFTLAAIGHLAFITMYSSDTTFSNAIFEQVNPMLIDLGFCRVWPLVEAAQTFGAGLTDESFWLTLDALQVHQNLLAK